VKSSAKTSQSKPHKAVKVTFGNALSRGRKSKLSEFFICDIAGFRCTMKEMKVEADKLDALSKQLQRFEELPIHRNILRNIAHGYSLPNQVLSIFMGWFDETLNELILRREGQLFPERTLKEMLLDVARGLQLLHNHQIVHKLLRADNIFVISNEKQQFSLLLGNYGGLSTLSRSSSRGPNIYWAPEIYLGEPETTASDVWAFGVVAHMISVLREPQFGVIAGFLKPAYEIDMNKEGKIMEKLLQVIFLQCTKQNATERPTITQIKEILLGSHNLNISQSLLSHKSGLF